MQLAQVAIKAGDPAAGPARARPLRRDLATCRCARARRACRGPGRRHPARRQFGSLGRPQRRRALGCASTFEHRAVHPREHVDLARRPSAKVSCRTPWRTTETAVTAKGGRLIPEGRSRWGSHQLDLVDAGLGGTITAPGVEVGTSWSSARLCGYRGGSGPRVLPRGLGVGRGADDSACDPDP